jgi:hypothetical protein
MDRARWRKQLNPPATRRGLATLITLLALAMLSTGPALARGPHGSSGQPENDTYIPVRTPAEAAFEKVKLDIAAGIRHFAARAAQHVSRSDLAAPDSVCVSDCGGGGGSGGGGIGGGTGGGDGSTGTTGPAPTVVLDARARHQSVAFWCGPASGQVVINYSRGYAFSTLTGDSTATNWKTQDIIAGWMKTTESLGTMGGNLAAALNRPDAVLKPVPDWSYVYSTNTDGADMHAKVLTDVWKYAMPLVIAVKPHKTGADYWLPSWPNDAGNAKHWITIYGYNGLWDGTDGPTVNYTESAGNGGKGPGPYVAGSMTMWKVNQYNASTIVW